MSNLFVVFRIDKGLVWITSSRKSLILSVVKCGVEQYYGEILCHTPKNPKKTYHCNSTYYKYNNWTFSRHHNYILLLTFASIPTMIQQILQSLLNSVYPTIFILNHNLISYTIKRTIYLQSDKINHHHVQISTQTPR